MNTYISKSLILLTCMASLSSLNVEAQLRNTLPQKDIYGIVNNASNADADGLFVCNSNTTSISVEVTNPTENDFNPHVMTADKSGVNLKIYNSEGVVFNKTYQYKDYSFEKLIAKVKSAKLRKVKLHGETLAGCNTSILKFNNSRGTYFTLTDDAGKMDYEGEFDDILIDIIDQIPDFNTLISADYSKAKPIELPSTSSPNPSSVTSDIQVQNENVDLQTLQTLNVRGSEKLLSAGADDKIKSFDFPNQTASLTVKWAKAESHDFFLVPAKAFRIGTATNVVWGISYENIVVNSVYPKFSVSKEDKVATFKFKPENGQVYILFDMVSKKGYPFKASTVKIPIPQMKEE